MRQSSYEIYGGQKKLRAIAGDHFVPLQMKIRKGDVKALLNENEVLEAGTLITSDGKPVTSSTSGTNVYGIVYQDKSFKGSMSPTVNVDDATENISVFLHGVLYEDAVKFNADKSIKEVEKAALKLIIFTK